MSNFDIIKYFNKKYIFRNDTSENLISKDKNTENYKKILNQLESIKSQLNCIKEQTGNYDLDMWSAHTKSRDPSQLLFRKIRQEYHPELLTQAWLKFYEILSNFNIIDSTNKHVCHINSVHLCEAPGAFITALNHYLSNVFENYKFQYLGLTLNPYYPGNLSKEMISHDRFIINNIKHWYFGIDDTGDIKSFHNYLGLVNEVHTKFDGKVDLVTADGSVDCMDDPGNQENTVFHLIFCETIAALTILSKGGAYVFKMFTMFEKNTIALLHLINTYFENIIAFKPCTSKAGNSEIYIICLNYYGPQSLTTLWPKLINCYMTNNSSQLHSFFEIPINFLREILNCASLFTNYQIETISNNLSSFGSCADKSINMLKINIVNYFLNERYQLKKLNPKYLLMDQNKDGLYIHQSVSKHSDYFQRFTYANFDFFGITNNAKNLKTNDINIVIGRKYTKIYCTKFCDFEIFELLSNVFIHFIPQPNDAFILCDCSGFYNFDDFDYFEKQCFRKITRTILDNLENGQSLCILNFLPLSIFSVSILYCLMFTFEEIGCNPGRRQFLFKNFYKNLYILDLLKDLIDTQDILDKNIQRSSQINYLPTFIRDTIQITHLNIDNYEKTILRFIDPQKVFLDHIFEFVKFYNNFVFEKCNAPRKKK